MSKYPDGLIFRENATGRREKLLRLVTYNILADNYANTPFAREKLYHYCPGKFLNVDFRYAWTDHSARCATQLGVVASGVSAVKCTSRKLSICMLRKQLATWEILQYDADVVCLQEVARDVYDG